LSVRSCTSKVIQGKTVFASTMAEEDAQVKELNLGGDENMTGDDNGTPSMAFSLAPVQDNMSDQSNTAPKKIVIPEAGCTLGRNPFTGIMDALVSRELLHITVDPASDKFPNGQLSLRALRVPNKVTLNKDPCFIDDLNSFKVNVGDVVSLYGSKYRYTVEYGPEDVSERESSLPTPTSGGLSGTKKTPFGVKVAPASGRSERSRRKSSAIAKQPSRPVLQQSVGGSSLLQWAFFVVFSGCLIALVFILARNTAKDEEDEGAHGRFLQLQATTTPVHLRGSAGNPI